MVADVDGLVRLLVVRVGVYNTNPSWYALLRLFVGFCR